MAPILPGQAQLNSRSGSHAVVPFNIAFKFPLSVLNH
jgi:hypothetical protein